MVQRLSNPRLVTDSQSGGGTVHQSYGKIGAPGSPAIDGSAQAFEYEDLADVMTGPGTPGTDRNLLGPDGSPRDPVDAPFDQTGGWSQVKGISR
jgi:hypothetical protein